MIQKDKDLLLRDLCARLPYGVKVHTNIPEMDYSTEELIECESDKTLSIEDIDWLNNDCGEFKPYLRPMSSMTDEERNFIEDKFNAKVDYGNGCYIETYTSSESGVAEVYMEKVCELIVYLNSRHYDYNRKYDEKDKRWKSMIELGLALPAPKGMYD